MASVPTSKTFPQRLQALADRLYTLERRTTVQAGNDVVVTASGVGRIDFPIKYGSTPVVVANGGNGESITFVEGAYDPDPDGFNFVAYNQAGAPITGAVRVYWYAAPRTQRS